MIAGWIHIQRIARGGIRSCSADYTPRVGGTQHHHSAGEHVAGDLPPRLQHQPLHQAPR